MILREYVEDGFKITEYTSDGETVSARVEENLLNEEEIPSNPVEFVPQPTIEEKILAENQYQTMLLELNQLGGM